ncbi:predicted protein [Sparassis crispa]|uniref:BTB domain-containing protein n=1 Tax=Sparassis crispa TaxID=139825 RepID=A0A401H502_9APHY|nr:predicted protein [Sparassis crispa]GBE89526.1 predicted protein [Sparassis crispa]
MQTMASGQPRTPQVTDAPPPFDKPTADIILRSSDRVDFRVKKAILAETSSFFESMFTLPQPSLSVGEVTRIEADGSEADYKDGLAVVHITEDSRTIDCLLRICYPLRNPVITDLSELRRLLTSATKYAMDEAVEILRERLYNLAQEIPLQVYAVAIQLNFEKEAREAAKHFLACQAPVMYAPELEEISGGAYQRLLDYRRRCGKKAKGLVSEEMRWLPAEDWPWFSCCSGQCAEAGVAVTFGVYVSKRPKMWWQHVHRMACVLEATPCGKMYATDLMDQALQDAAACPRCRVTAPAKLRRFMDLLAVEVDRVVTQMELEIK